MIDAFQPVREFEKQVGEYTGAPYVVSVNSCSMALLLAFARYRSIGGNKVIMPARTYPSVPMSAYHAGLSIVFSHKPWAGVYNVEPSDVWDCAKRFTGGMYVSGQVQCVSFHAAKMLKLGQGGAILHDDAEADGWYRRMRFDGRAEGVATGDDTYEESGWHCYLSPDVAARGSWLMQSYPPHVPDQEMHDYPDMSRWVELWTR